MDDHAIQDLHYGHLGSVEYQEADQSWVCQRLPVQCPALTIIQEDYCIVGNDPSGDTSAHRRSNGSIQTPKNSRQLADAIPSLAGAVSLLEDLAKADQWKTASTGLDGEQCTGNLLAFGSSYGLQSATKDPASIVAYVQGPNRDQLWIAQTRPVTQRLGSDSPQSIVSLLRPVPSLHPTWVCPSGQILQVNFSGSFQDRHTLLAVRSFTTIYVFRPLLTAEPAKGSSIWKSAHAHSVSANQILKLRNATLLQSTCIDFVFNPWFQWQLVVIDDTGRFTIVEISNKQKVSASHTSKIVAQGTVGGSPGDKSHAPGGQACRLVWLHNAHAFLATCHRTVAVFDTRNTSVYLTAIYLQQDIFDVVQSPKNKSEFFVLTTGQIKWMRVITLDNGNVTLQTLSTWRHYFDMLGADFKLTFRGTDVLAASFLVLYSRKTFLMVEYALGDEDSNETRAWHVTNPSLVENKDLLLGRAGMLGLHITQVYLHAGSDDADDIRDHFQLMILDKNMSLTSYTCAATRTESSDEVDVGRQRNPATHSWRGRVRPLVKDDWLVEDDASDASGLDNEAARLREFREDQNFAANNNLIKSHGKGVSHERIFEAVTTSDGSHQVDLVTQVGKLLTGTAYSTQTEYLFESANSSLTIQDLDSAEKYTGSLFDHDLTSKATITGLTTGKHSLPLSLDFGVLPENMQAPRALSAIYDRIIATWIGSLSGQISARTRVRLERIARSVTASVWLATHRIVGKEAGPAETPQPSQSAVSVVSSSHQGSSYVEGFSSLPSSLPLSTMSASQEGQTQEEVGQSNEAAVRLARYTSIANPPAATTLTDPILSHWTQGADPADYDFGAETARLTGTLNVAGSQMSAEVYARQKRRAAMQEERRQQRLAKRLRTSMGGSSVAGSSQTLNASSQPESNSEQLWQNSQLVSQTGSLSQDLAPSSEGTRPDSQAPQVASQIQPGRHGGRLMPASLAMRTKGKRKAGF